MYFSTIVFIVLNLVLSSNSGDLYPSYNLSIDPMKAFEWSDSPALVYIKTVRLFDYDHHIFQYRRYPCQFFYTDEIQLFYNNETLNQCLYNTTKSDYEYSFQLHFDSRHVEPYILRNIAIQCNYINCSLSLLNMTYVNIGWNLRGRENNPDCSFDIDQPYNITRTPYTVSEIITLRCKSLSACNRSKSNIEQFLSLYIRLIYGSSYELQMPYCSLEKSLSHVINTNFVQTNSLLQQIIELMQRGSGKADGSEQEKIKESVEHVSTTTNDTLNS
ncbi:unnamed protein product [Rotaria sp. Silwood2]|nr:unnamed protein product [Rotaria sp. Silwood2]CAF2635192.1 unnamed protein product [Rotaria sp. Silwood2]CAF3051122.1 unnamed protein product [Rotaria sp. Silwood2]CAF4085580.1 unnamed protein product [Rotaria sp. Silwood2]CAF4745060.1 unnamed protein product [Rotaria sp. Silwood2]